MKTLLREPVALTNQCKTLEFLYNTLLGRALLHILRAKWLSKAVGAFLNTPLSKPLIKPFIKKADIDLKQCENTDFSCFNDCFCRKLKQGLRTIAPGADVIVSPCDALLSVYRIKGNSIYPVKQSEYTVSSLLKNDELAREFENGYMYVFRLCVEHYHRYCYPTDGVKGDNIYINGVLNTVRPVACYKRKVFCENSREYTVIDTDNFGRIVQMEVGAMLVGKIDNYHGAGQVRKGEEKGKFLYGGSTIILLFKENSITPPEELIENTEKALETPVYQGEQIN